MIDEIEILRCFDLGRERNASHTYLPQHRALYDRRDKEAVVVGVSGSETVSYDVCLAVCFSCFDKRPTLTPRTRQLRSNGRIPQRINNASSDPSSPRIVVGRFHNVLYSLANPVTDDPDGPLYGSCSIFYRVHTLKVCRLQNNFFTGGFFCPLLFLV